MSNVSEIRKLIDIGLSYNSGNYFQPGVGVALYTSQ